MENVDRLAAMFPSSSRNAVLSWLLVGVLALIAIGGGWLEAYASVLFAVVAIVIATAPAVTFRDLTVMPPWYFLFLIALPVLWEAFGPQPLVTGIVPALAMGTLGLLAVVELHRFTSLRLVPWFSVVLTVVLTLAMIGLLNVLWWSSDTLFGTTFLLDGRSQDAINAAVMIEFSYAVVAGLLAGLVVYAHFRFSDETVGSRTGTAPSPEPDAEAARSVDPVVLSDRLGIPTDRQHALVRAMQLVLVGILFYGLLVRDLPVITNAALALVITFVPAMLRQNYALPIEPGLALWVASAVFLHTLGTVALYDAIAPYDHLTHTLSASVVAAGGYAVLRAIQLHERSIHFPPWAMFSFLLVFILAIGVIWEILEFVADQSALALGLDPVLAQHGIDDTIVDMIFNVFGAILVAAWGTLYLVELSEGLADLLEERLET
ncbi:hypothetical protein [Natronobacterium gregoryi]|nr:hypothetical protein C490_01005 [Natronobacterium gregoryi SP2]PLK19879.1 hypothetical protein CYV19_12255 [Natronobacterium gregoryi SP2]